MRSRWILPSALVVLPLALTGATAVLAVRGGLTEFTLTLLPSSAVGGIVGGLLAGLRPRYVGGWLMLTTALAFLVGQLAEQVAYQGLVVSPGTVAYASTALWVGNWIFPPALVPSFVLVPLTFPDGHLPSRRWRPLLVFALLVAVEVAVLGAFGSPTLRLGDQYWPNPFAITALAGVIPTALIAGELATLAAAVAATGSLAVRWHRADASARRQIMWVALALLVVAVGFAVDASVALLAPAAYPSIFPVLQVVPVVVPLAIAVSILRRRLFDIEVVFSRALVYTVLTAALLGAYVATVAVVTSLVPSSDVVGRLLGTAVVAVAFAPLRSWLQNLVKRQLFGGRAEPYAALTSLARQLEAPTPPDRVLDTLAMSVAQTLRSPFASVQIARSGVVSTAAEYGQPPSNGSDVVSVDLTHGGERVGRLTVGHRGHQPFSAADLRLLADLALPVGAAAHAVQLSVDLQRSRERLVLTVEEERRRLGRDLHDSLGPQLAAISMQVEAAHDLVRSDPDRTVTMLADLLEQTESAVRETRQMAHTHRPPALDALGLVAALQAHISHLTAVPVQMTVPRALPPLPAAVEVAAYRIALEALANVVAHAGAGSCRLRVTHDGDRLLVEVDDDGRGITEGDSVGMGQQSMRERAEELGGSVAVRRRPDGPGTTVVVALPCGATDGPWPRSSTGTETTSQRGSSWVG